MEKCKVIFSNEDNQSIVIELNLDDLDNLNYNLYFDPIVRDPNTNLGLAGKMCEIFIDSLENGKDSEKQN